jgi:putative peptide zinc metalloprotease protein
MTTAAPVIGRPKLRQDIVLGPPLVSGKTVVHHLKDPRTGWFFRVGPREFFVISRLDGERTMEEIGREYARHFGKRLGDEHWRQILGLLGSRCLLAGTDDPGVLDQLAQAQKISGKGRQHLLLYRRSLVNPDRLVTLLHPRLRFAFSPLFVIPATAAILAMLSLLAVRYHAVYADARHGFGNTLILLSSILIVWICLAIHETAHGLTCKHYGGTPDEIGILWRFPLLVPYCRADDVVLFWARRHRVYTAFAGIFSGLLMALPFTLLWLLSPPGSELRSLGAAVMLFSGGAALLNLLPFLQLDGYFMLNHALGVANLRMESYQFLGGAVVGLARRRNPVAGYRPWTCGAYLGYAVISLLYGAVLAVRMMVFLYRGLDREIGATGAALGLPALLVAGAVLAALSLRRRRRRRALLPGATVVPPAGQPTQLGGKPR